MEYTHLGRIGLRVSRLCLGTVSFGRHTSQEESLAILDHALQAGIIVKPANKLTYSKIYGIL